MPVELSRTVGTQNQICAPGRKFQRQPLAVISASIDGDRLIAHFPAVAIRTMEYTPAVEGVKSVDLWQQVGDASRQQEFSARERLSAA